MNNYEFKVKWCKACNQGWVEIVKDKNNEKLLLRCSECMSQWNNIEELSSGIFKEDEVEVVKPEVEVIIKQGWVKYIIKN
ncbi:hypothetical protein [Rummeliibacillus pycnus]|uniref:hypothetical protein n=1 Tax=Rummeliibacillus pycnus TaxID=101070 RepID=UPI003D2B3E57